MANEVETENPKVLPPEEPQVVVPAQTRPAIESFGTTQAVPEPLKSPVSHILAGFEGELASLEEALAAHKTAIAPLVAQAINETEAAHLAFVTSSELGQKLASYVSRISDIAAEVRSITGKLEL